MPLKTRRSEGLTLLEVMFAVAILGTGMLAMLAMQTATMKHARRGKEHTEAALIVQTRAEFLQRQPWAAVPAIPWTNVGAPIQANIAGGIGGGAPTTYTLQERVTATADPNLRLIDVRVTWVDPSAPPGSPPRRYAISSAKHNDP
ncbi:MAG: prepilin-type N-terminal cleavage/methylation domain-containing protein [Myxococcota bacterium]|nr:prepilin-type N-terminal cleavage/methylation domain-containing protein [Myxococcota bacterium]